MGKESKRKRDDSSSDSSDSDESRHKKHKKDKKDKKEKKSKEKKHKHKKGETRRSDVKPISEDDYFAKNPEFRVWLAESKDKRFGDLSEADARSYFRKFIKQYNSGELSSRIYDGVSFSEIDPSMRHSHKWKFAKGLDSFEQETVRDKIFHDTKNAAILTSTPAQAALRAKALAAGGAAAEDPETARERAAAALQAERRAARKRDKETLEELAPRPDPGSFQARIEKRYAKGAYCRDKQGASPEPLRQSDLMGGDDGIRARLQREQMWRSGKEAAKQADRQQKLEAYQDKEKATMNEFRRQMGLPPAD